MKKSIKSIALLSVLCAFLFAGCATYPSSADSTPPPSTLSSTQKPVRSDLSTIPEAYNTVLELMSEDYQAMSLRDFNAAVSAKIEMDSSFLSTYSEFMESLIVLDTEVPSTKKPLIVDDNVYQFINETLNYSISEIILPRISNPISFSKSLQSQRDEYTAGLNNDKTQYNFSFYSFYFVEYRVIDDAALTVQERDELLRAYQTELQNAVNNMSKEQLLDSNCHDTLQKIADDLAIDLSTDVFIFENADISSIELRYVNENGEYVNTDKYFTNEQE